MYVDLLSLVIGEPLVGSNNTIVALDGMSEQVIEFTLVNAVPPVLQEDILPSYTRYDGVDSAFNFSKENLEFLISPVDIYLSEGSYTVSVSNPAGLSNSTVYLDVQSKTT